MRELPDFIFFRGQMINPAVTDVAEIHPARREPAQTQSGLHPGAFFVTAPQISQRAMDLTEQFRQHIGKARFQAGGGLPERTRQQRRDFFHRNLARIFARQRAAHPVADGESKIHFLHRGFPNFSQPLDFPRIKLQAKERIFVVLPHLADVRAAGPLQRGGFFCGRIFHARIFNREIRRPRERKFPVCVFRGSGKNSGWISCRLGFGQDGGEFKINQTKAPVGKPVGDIAHIGIIVAHAKRLQFRE